LPNAKGLMVKIIYVIGNTLDYQDLVCRMQRVLFDVDLHSKEIFFGYFQLLGWE